MEKNHSRVSSSESCSEDTKFYPAEIYNKYQKFTLQLILTRNIEMSVADISVSVCQMNFLLNSVSQEKSFNCHCLNFHYQDDLHIRVEHGKSFKIQAFDSLSLERRLFFLRKYLRTAIRLHNFAPSSHTPRS